MSPTCVSNDKEQKQGPQEEERSPDREGGVGIFTMCVNAVLPPGAQGGDECHGNDRVML